MHFSVHIIAKINAYNNIILYSTIIRIEKL